MDGGERRGAQLNTEKGSQQSKISQKVFSGRAEKKGEGKSSKDSILPDIPGGEKFNRGTNQKKVNQAAWVCNRKTRPRERGGTHKPTGNDWHIFRLNRGAIEHGQGVRNLEWSHTN